MTATRPYEVSNMTTSEKEMEKELGRLKARVDLALEEQECLLRSCRLTATSRVIDCACGPGYVTRRLCDAVKRGFVLGVDIDPVQLRNAKETLRDVSPERYELVQADLYQHEFPRETYDLVYSRLTFAQLKDPVKAAANLRRALKPGGVLAAFDMDYRLPWQTLPESKAVKRLEKAWETYLTSRGMNVFVGLDLARSVLLEAGFER